MNHFPFMARFTAWANGRLYDCVAGFPDEVYRRDCGLFFGSIHGTLNHILATLFNHQTHHRGHVTAAVSQAGVAPPPLDVIFYTEEIGLSGDPGTAAARA